MTGIDDTEETHDTDIRLEIFSISQDSYDSKELEIHQKIYLEDNFYSAIGLSGHDAFLGQGVVLISPT